MRLRMPRSACRGDAHRELVFNVAHGALAKAKLQSPRTWKEAKLADEMARRACGLDDRDAASQSLLIHINETVNDFDPYPIEANVIDAALLPGTPVSISQETASPNES
jgi:hypothetical protein